MFPLINEVTNMVGGLLLAFLAMLLPLSVWFIQWGIISRKERIEERATRILVTLMENQKLDRMRRD